MKNKHGDHARLSLPSNVTFALNREITAKIIPTLVQRVHKSDLA